MGPPHPCGVQTRAREAAREGGGWGGRVEGVVCEGNRALADSAPFEPCDLELLGVGGSVSPSISELPELWRAANSWTKNLL